MFTQPKLSDKDALHHERMVLGTVMLDPSNVIHAARALSPAFFRDSRHRIIFGAIMALHRSYTPINVVNVVNSLVARKALSVVGGAAYLAELVAYAKQQAQAHHDAAIRAGVQQAGGKVE